MSVIWRSKSSEEMDFCGNAPICRILLKNAEETQIRLNSEYAERLIDIYESATYGVGSWRVEIVRPQPAFPHILTVFPGPFAVFSSPLNVSFNRTVFEAEITTFLKPTPEARRFRDVSCVTISLGEICVESGRLPASVNENGVRVETEQELSRTKAALAKAEQELSTEKAALVKARQDFEAEKAALAKAERELLRTKATLAEAKQNLEAEQTALAKAEQELSTEKAAFAKAKQELSTEKAALAKAEQELLRTKATLAETKQELEAERRYNARLQIAADGRLQELLTNLKRESEHLNRALKDKLAEAEALSGKARETEKALSDKTAEAERLNQELENSVALLELKTLDCEQARQTLDSLRERNLLDEDTLELMRAEPFLKGASVRKTLETVERELDAAEDKIGLIIRLREKINNAVQMAILAGDGRLPLSEELGGNRNGGG